MLFYNKGHSSNIADLVVIPTHNFFDAARAVRLFIRFLAPASEAEAEAFEYADD